MSNGILIKYDNFSPGSMQENGFAFIAEGKLILTPSGNDQSASAYYTQKITLSDNGSFSTYFVFQIQRDENNRADGFTFIVQPNDITSIGAYGGYLGYSGIANSLAIEFDTYLNTEFNDPNNNHAAIDTNGSVFHTTSLDVVNLTSIGYDIAPIPPVPYYVWIDYNNTTQILELRINNSNNRPALPVLSKSINLVSDILHTEDVYVGFTAGTGDQYEQHQILSWYFDNKYNPINVQTRGVKFE